MAELFNAMITNGFTIGDLNAYVLWCSDSALDVCDMRVFNMYMWLRNDRKE